MDNKIKSLGAVIDALDDFLDDLDETCGLAAMRYGDEAHEALEFLHDYSLAQWRKEHSTYTENPYKWISVKDRLPEEDVRVLVYLNTTRSYTKIDTDRRFEGKWVRWSTDVTYWMPLPAPPEN